MTVQDNQNRMIIDPRRLFIFDAKRGTFLVLFAGMFVITEIGRHIYRPYIYAHDIFDFWIADTIGNFTGTIAIIFFELGILNPDLRSGKRIILLITAGLIVYEVIQYFLPGTNTCDWRDIVATITAGGISLVIFNNIMKAPAEK